MDKKALVLQRLRELDALRRRVQETEQAMAVLSPEERLVAERLFVHPYKGNVQVLCQELGVEKSSIYRRREAVMEKLMSAMFPQVAQ